MLQAHMVLTNLLSPMKKVLLSFRFTISTGVSIVHFMNFILIALKMKLFGNG